MNSDYEIFCDELKGLTNKEALDEVFKKMESFARIRHEQEMSDSNIEIA